MSDATSALLPVYRRCEILMQRGEGCYLFDDAGKRYLDFASGIATNALGHGHPALLRALHMQADQLWHCSNLFRNAPLEAFATALTQASGMDQVFFCSSGTEAVEAAIKSARRYHYMRGEVARTEFITAEGAFHGRTTGALAACSHPASKVGFEPLMPGFSSVAFHDVRALEAAMTPRTAAVLLETIQGEGGVRVHSPEYLQQVRALCDAQGVLLILDEIQCGYGRTGELFAHQAAGIMPDILTAAKGMGGGFPLAAMLCSERAGSGMTPGTHGSTYGANPLACAVGMAVLEVVLGEGFLHHAHRMGEVLHAALESVVAARPDRFTAVRGRGLMLGLELAEGVDKAALAADLRDRGLLTAPAVAPVLRILPPLVVGQEEIAQAAQMLS